MSNQESENNKRIAKNTIALYIRTLITMAVGLYTSRVVLNVLGVEDYGVYNVVGGVVSISSVMKETGLSKKNVTRELQIDYTKVSYEALDRVS